MKRLIVLSLSFIMMLCLVACGNDNTADNRSDTQTLQENTTSDSIVETKPTGDETNDTPPIISNNTENGTQGSDKNHTHTYKKVVIAPTCEKDGFTSYSCDCGAQYSEDTVMAKGHSFNAWKEKKAATETSVGKEERKCKNCDKTENRDIPKLIAGHTHKYTASVTKKATCQSEGVKTFACSCGAKYTESIGKTSHNYKSEVAKPTCTAAGYTKYTCNCGKTYYDDTVNPTSHNYVDKKTPATCTTKGYTTHTCKLCGDSYTDNYVDGGHNYVNGKCGTCGGKDPSYVVNWKFDNGVLTIYGKGPMEDYSSPERTPWYNQLSIVTKIVIEDGITHIGNYSFRGCQNAKSVEISDSVTSIGIESFSYCIYLVDLKLPNNLVKIGASAFLSCTHLTDFKIPNSVIEIGGSAFRNCRTLTKIELNNGNIQLGGYAFGECVSLTSVSLPNGIKEISNWLFYNCTALSNITIPNSVNSIGEYAFYYCESLSTVEVPGNVKSVGIFAFGFCKKLTNIKFCDGVENLAGLLFRGCSKLQRVEIPTSVISIGSNLFELCHKNIAIYGISGSYAETYANVNGYKFISQ